MTGASVTGAEISGPVLETWEEPEADPLTGFLALEGSERGEVVLMLRVRFGVMEVVVVVMVVERGSWGTGGRRAEVSADDRRATRVALQT
jgi:hypothetical protein